MKGNETQTGETNDWDNHNQKCCVCPHCLSPELLSSL